MQKVHHEIRSKTNDNPQTLDISLRARRTPLLPGRLAIESWSTLHVIWLHETIECMLPVICCPGVTGWDLWMGKVVQTFFGRFEWNAPDIFSWNLGPLVIWDIVSLENHDMLTSHVSKQGSIDFLFKRSISSQKSGFSIRRHAHMSLVRSLLSIT